MKQGSDCMLCFRTLPDRANSSGESFNALTHSVFIDTRSKAQVSGGVDAYQ